VHDALRAHRDDCAAACGRWHGTACALQAVHAVLQPRLMSTLLALVLLLAGALWLA
jgi:hypothetical protein